MSNSSGGLVPFSAFVTGSWTVGPQSYEIYNGVEAYEILGQPAEGVSSGTAMADANNRDLRDSVLNVQEAQAQYQRQVAQDVDELVLLAGAPIPDALMQKLQAVNGLSAEPPLPQVPAGLPSDLLVRRPDSRAAEQATFFPPISLTANGGVASNSLNSLFVDGQGPSLFEPQITLPIFTGGRISPIWMWRRSRSVSKSPITSRRSNARSMMFRTRRQPGRPMSMSYRRSKVWWMRIRVPTSCRTCCSLAESTRTWTFWWRRIRC